MRGIGRGRFPTRRRRRRLPSVRLPPRWTSANRARKQKSRSQKFPTAAKFEPPLSRIMDSTSSSSSASPSPSGYGMVEMELDAAVALANLAGQAAAVGTSSPAQDDPTQAGICSSSATAAADNREIEERLEHSSEMAGSSSVRPPTKRGTRQSMTEAEKEERRMRRVLANRESARQTIRRRQALRDELTKKLAYLRLENDNMKLEKELATQEYLSLKDTNALLKEQIANTVRGEIDINSAATEAEPSACSSSKPYEPTISFVEQTAAGSVRPRPHEPAKQIAENEKEARGDLQVKLASADQDELLYQDPGSHRIQTPDEALRKAAATNSAAAEARKRRKELTKLKHHHARTKTS